MTPSSARRKNRVPEAGVTGAAWTVYAETYFETFGVAVRRSRRWSMCPGHTEDRKTLS